MSDLRVELDRLQAENERLLAENGLLQSALKVIYTWASVQLKYGDFYLDPIHVIHLCKKSLDGE